MSSDYLNEHLQSKEHKENSESHLKHYLINYLASFNVFQQYIAGNNY